MQQAANNEDDRQDADDKRAGADAFAYEQQYQREWNIFAKDHNSFGRLRFPAMKRCNEGRSMSAKHEQ